MLGYIVFGLGNIYCFSVAMKSIPASTAMAVWLGVALAGVKIMDVLVFKEPLLPVHLVYFLLIIIGAIGLKATTTA